MQYVFWCFASIVNVDVDSPCEAQAKRDAVIDHSVDQTGRYALMLFAHAVGENDRCCWKGHVHTPNSRGGQLMNLYQRRAVMRRPEVYLPWNDNHADKSLSPVSLTNRRCCNEDLSDGEESKGDGHHPSSAQSGQYEAGADRCQCSRYGDGTAVSHGE